MKKENGVPFTKFHGMGNDWIIALSDNVPSALDAFARTVCDRHTGIGADGFIGVSPAPSEDSDAQVVIVNADGSKAEMSGNGIRCAAAFILHSGLRAKERLRIRTASGVKRVQLVLSGEGTWVFCVAMGAPVLAPDEIPFEAAGSEPPIRNFPLRVQDGSVKATVTSMGNPHCTVFVDDLEGSDWVALGRQLEKYELFPKRSNVEFVRVLSRNEVEVRFWERGAGHTLSSGTGACAAAVASILNGLTEREVDVRTEAGTLKVAWPENGEVYLTGPVEIIAEGQYFYHVK